MPQVMNKVKENNRRIYRLIDFKPLPKTYHKKFHNSPEKQHKYDTKVAASKFFMAYLATESMKPHEKVRFNRKQEMKLPYIVELLSRHDDKKYGVIDNLTYTIIYNLFEWRIYFIPDYVHTGDNIMGFHAESYSDMFDLASVFADMYDNDINKVSKLFIYLLEDYLLQENTKLKNVVDIDWLKRELGNLDDTMLEQLRELPLHMLDNMFLYNTKLQKNVSTFGGSDVLPYKVTELEEFLRKML